MKYKLYIFDLDLTLIDSLISAKMSYEAAFKAANLKLDESKLMHYLTTHLKETYDEVCPNGSMYLDFLHGYQNESVNSFPKYSKIFPDGIRLIEKLKKKNKLMSIVTNRNTIDIEVFLKNYPQYQKDFSKFVSSDDIKNLKPAPDGILKCISLFGIDKKDIVYFGDSPNDYLACLKANIDFIYIDRYNQSLLKDIKTIHSFDELDIE